MSAVWEDPDSLGYFRGSAEIGQSWLNHLNGQIDKIQTPPALLTSAQVAAACDAILPPNHQWAIEKAAATAHQGLSRVAEQFRRTAGYGRLTPECDL